MGARGNDAACGADALLGHWCGQAIALVDPSTPFSQALSSSTIRSGAGSP